MVWFNLLLHSLLLRCSLSDELGGGHEIQDTVTATSSDFPRAWRELQHTILGGWVGRLYSTYHTSMVIYLERLPLYSAPACPGASGCHVISRVSTAAHFR